MKIKRFEVSGLLGHSGILAADLKEDLNIVTGRNGAGKTTLLKLLWYVMSGNILLALQEVSFSRITLHTDIYECTVHRLGILTCRVELTIEDKKIVFEDIVDEDGDVLVNAEDEANPRLISVGNSVFFPTFRRIEGGFTLTTTRRPPSPRQNLLIRPPARKSDIEDALVALSKRLTNGQHIFVSSISTADIVGILLSQYAELSDKYASLQQSTSLEVIESIKAFRSDSENVQRLDDAKEILDQIRTRIEEMELHREAIMTPIDAVRDLVQRLFRHKGIAISSRLSFGDAAGAVNSDALSAGEKQMLSFICYNAFNHNGVVFIDEPELSLHVDWQRQLFPTLLSQKSSNQFIVATHSPFIYSKYPDKEILIDLDRGDQERA